MLPRKCKVSCTKNPALTRSQITEKHRHRYRRRRTPHLNFVIDAEETRTPPTVADSRTRHVIIVERWTIFQELSCLKQHGKPKQPPKTPPNTQVHPVEYSESDEFKDVLGSTAIQNVCKPSSNVIWVDLKAEGKPLKMELDTGSAVFT